MRGYRAKHLDTTPPVSPLGHHPALDGLRGAAVIAVLLFHQGFGWARGGFLGVSAFFTLSGFLITSILLTRDRDLPVEDRFRTFWTRRARRLLPAAWLTIAGTLVLAAAGGIEGRDVGGDALAALGHVANWRLLVGDVSYSGLFDAPSPFQHFWSLAIEEQFYVLLPLALIFGLRRFTASQVLGAVIGLSLGSALLAGVFGAGDRAYYGTDTRAVELLVGVAAGLVVFGGRFRSTPQLRRAVSRLGVPAAVVLVAAWSVARVDAELLYRGGLSIHALATLAVIGAALVGGPVRTVLAVAPLAGLGRISYGVYLYHWPVFLWLDEPRLGLADWSLFAVRVAVTLALALASFALVEMPVRRRELLRWPAPVPAVAVAVVALFTLAAIAPGATRTGTPEFDEAARRLDEATAIDPTTVETVTAAATPEPEVLVPVRVGVFGDSTGLMTAAGLLEYSERHPSEIADLTGLASFGCTLTRQGTVHYHLPFQPPDRQQCIERDTTWAEVADTHQIDVAVIQFGPWEVADHVLGAGDVVRAPGDPIYDAVLAQEIREATRLFTRRGIVVLWLSAPHIELGRNEQPPPDPPYPASDDARMDRYNALVREHAGALADRGEAVAIVDLAGWLAAEPEGGEDGTLRPDGVHFTVDTALDVAERWLADEIVNETRRLQPD